MYSERKVKGGVGGRDCGPCGDKLAEEQKTLRLSHACKRMFAKSVRFWQCGGRPKSEDWRESPLGVLDGFSHNECVTLQVRLSLGQNQEDDINDQTELR